MELQGFLDELGSRLRSAREQASKSVTDAAREAGVSRRFWTETEAGRANPSVLVLARMSLAVGARLSALVDRLPARRRATERIALVGLRGAGKSTVGRLLAREHEVPFVELDRRVEELAGLSLAEIFDLHGAEVFRRYEAEALERVLAEGERVVIATGGSIVTNEATYARLRETCHCVWLRARPEDHFGRVVEQGDRRPMAENPRAMEELRAILARREPLYALCAHTVETSGKTPAEVVVEILAPGGARRPRADFSRGRG
jgi:XRE family aerobic/anaerobic benzoate catabolism transcriptional regulator